MDATINATMEAAAELGAYGHQDPLVLNASLAGLGVVWGLALLAGIALGATDRCGDYAVQEGTNEKVLVNDKLRFTYGFLAKLLYLGGIFGMFTLQVLILKDIISAFMQLGGEDDGIAPPPPPSTSPQPPAPAPPSPDKEEPANKEGIKILIIVALIYNFLSTACATVLILQYYAALLEEQYGSAWCGGRGLQTVFNYCYCECRWAGVCAYYLALGSVFCCVPCCSDCVVAYRVCQTFTCRSKLRDKEEVQKLRTATIVFEARGTVSMWLQSLPLLTISAVRYSLGYSESWEYLLNVSLTGIMIAGYLYGQGQYIGRYHSPYRCSPNDRLKLDVKGKQRHVMVAIMIAVTCGLLSILIMAASPGAFLGAELSPLASLSLACYFLAFFVVPCVSPVFLFCCREEFCCPDHYNTLSDDVEGQPQADGKAAKGVSDEDGGGRDSGDKGSGGGSQQKVRPAQVAPEPRSSSSDSGDGAYEYDEVDSFEQGGETTHRPVPQQHQGFAPPPPQHMAPY